MSFNKLFNDFANEQGVEPGSDLWMKAGIMPYSGTTGGHGAYGWRHDYKLNLTFVKAVLANYGHRRCYYGNEPRLGAYENAGRAKPYVMELPGDNSKGGADYITSSGKIVTVTGPDIQHFQMGPLFAVADSQGYIVKVQGNDMDASRPAKIMIQHLMKSMAWQLMKNGTDLSLYGWGWRGASCIVNALVQASKRNCIFPEDQKILVDWIEQVAVPEYELAPYPKNSIKGSEGLNPPVPNLPNGDLMQFHQLYNGLYWVLPPFYEASQLMPAGGLKDRLTAIVARWSQYMLDLEETVPGKGADIAVVSLPPAIIAGVNGGKAVPSWKPFITEANIHYSWSWNLWGLRAQYVSAKVLNNQYMLDAANKLAANLKQGVKFENKAWLVDQDLNWV